jgi:hypothetical protein
LEHAKRLLDLRLAPAFTFYSTAKKTPGHAAGRCKG